MANHFVIPPGLGVIHPIDGLSFGLLLFVQPTVVAWLTDCSAAVDLLLADRNFTNIRQL